MPTLIPLRHLTGWYVWQGNNLLGSVWHDRSGWRWTTRNILGRTFRFGVCEQPWEAIRELTS